MRVGMFSGNGFWPDRKLRGGVSILHLIDFIQIFMCLIIKKVFLSRNPSHYATETKKMVTITDLIFLLSLNLALT